MEEAERSLAVKKSFFMAGTSLSLPRFKKRSDSSLKTRSKKKLQKASAVENLNDLHSQSPEVRNNYLKVQATSKPHEVPSPNAEDADTLETAVTAVSSVSASSSCNNYQSAEKIGKAGGQMAQSDNHKMPSHVLLSSSKCHVVKTVTPSLSTDPQGSNASSDKKTAATLAQSSECQTPSPHNLSDVNDNEKRQGTKTPSSKKYVQESPSPQGGNCSSDHTVIKIKNEESTAKTPTRKSQREGVTTETKSDNRRSSATPVVGKTKDVKTDNKEVICLNTAISVSNTGKIKRKPGVHAQVKQVMGNLENVLGELKTVVGDLRVLVDQIDTVTDKIDTQCQPAGRRRLSAPETAARRVAMNDDISIRHSSSDDVNNCGRKHGANDHTKCWKNSRYLQVPGAACSHHGTSQVNNVSGDTCPRGGVVNNHSSDYTDYSDVISDSDSLCLSLYKDSDRPRSRSSDARLPCGEGRSLSLSPVHSQVVGRRRKIGPKAAASIAGTLGRESDLDSCDIFYGDTLSSFQSTDRKSSSKRCKTRKTSMVPQLEYCGVYEQELEMMLEKDECEPATTSTRSGRSDVDQRYQYGRNMSTGSKHHVNTWKRYTLECGEVSDSGIADDEDYYSDTGSELLPVDYNIRQNLMPKSAGGRFVNYSWRTVIMP